MIPMTKRAVVGQGRRTRGQQRQKAEETQRAANHGHPPGRRAMIGDAYRRRTNFVDPRQFAGAGGRAIG